MKHNYCVYTFSAIFVEFPFMFLSIIKFSESYKIQIKSLFALMKQKETCRRLEWSINTINGFYINVRISLNLPVKGNVLVFQKISLAPIYHYFATLEDNYTTICLYMCKIVCFYNHATINAFFVLTL